MVLLGLELIAAGLVLGLSTAAVPSSFQRLGLQDPLNGPKGVTPKSSWMPSIH